MSTPPVKRKLPSSFMLHTPTGECRPPRRNLSPLRVSRYSTPSSSSFSGHQPASFIPSVLTSEQKCTQPQTPLRVTPFSTPASSSFNEIPLREDGIPTPVLPEESISSYHRSSSQVNLHLSNSILSPERFQDTVDEKRVQPMIGSCIQSTIEGRSIRNERSRATATTVNHSPPENAMYSLPDAQQSSIRDLDNLNPINETDFLDSGSIYQPGSDEGELDTTTSDQSSDDVESFTSQENPDQVLQNRARAAELALSLLRLENIGCSPQAHSDASCPCAPNSCQNLTATYDDLPFLLHTSIRPPTGVPSALGLTSPSFPQPSEFGRSRFRDANGIRLQFEGSSSKAISPQHICLHKEAVPGTAPSIEYDIDGLIVFLESFNAFHDAYSVHVCFSKQIRFNITTNLHFKIPVSFTDSEGRVRTQARQIKDIPHLYLGTVPQFHQSSLFVVFPRLVSDDTKTSILTDKEASRFLDLWIRICQEYLKEATGQYLPPDYATADSKASAKGREHQTFARENILKEHRTYPIQAVILQRAWRKLTRTIDQTPGYYIFQNAQLLVNAKNTKLHEASSTLLPALETFRDRLEDVFSIHMLRYFLDIGVKIVPPRFTPRTAPEDDFSDEESTNNQYTQQLVRLVAMMYLWKACCLEKLYQYLQIVGFNGKQGTKNVYHNAYLRDATSMTIEPPARSWIRKAGIIYVQCYNSAKEIEDAQKIRPFDHDHLSNLALAAELCDSDTLYSRREKLVQSYCSSKERTDQSYQSFRSTTLGTRLELRVDGDLFNDIIQQLRNSRSTSDIEEESSDENNTTPSFLWNIPTAVWCDFVRGNHNKITSAIEMVILASPKEGIPKATSELLFMLLMYLQNFSNSQPQRHSLLWKGESFREGGRWVGMNLQQSILEYGFGWLPACIDWHGLRLRSGYIGQLIGCQTVGVAYKSSMRLVQDQQAIMELCYHTMLQAPPESKQRRRALQIAVHLVLRQYRRDIFDVIAKKELHEDFQSKEAQDRIGFCHVEMSVALIQKPWYVNNWKVTGAKDPVDLFKLLMSTEPHRRTRKSFDGVKMKRWRKMLYAVDQVVVRDKVLQDQWKKTLLREFQTYFTVWPYPDPAGVFVELESTTGQRKFFSAAMQDGVWKWTGAEPTCMTLPLYPKYLSMSHGEVKAYLGR